MNKIFSLIKATFSQDMNVFKLKGKKAGSPVGMFFFGIFFMCIFGFYAEGLMGTLEPVGKQFMVLTLFLTATTLLTLVEAVYKSQGILFSDKDINILFSLPIDKQVIVFLRILKMVVFELIYNTLFLLPAMVVYAIHVKPDIAYYPLAILILLISPILPTVIRSIIGYFVKYFSSKFTKKNVVQVVLSFIFILGIMYISFTSNGMLDALAENADSINNSIISIYYPIAMCVNVLVSFNMTDLLILLAINIIPLILFIIIGGKFYFKVFFALDKKVKVKKLEITDKTFKKRTPIRALVRKELGKFASSPILVINAYFGIILAVVLVIVVCFSFDNIIQQFTDTSGIEMARDNGQELSQEQKEELEKRMMEFKDKAEEYIGPALFCLIVGTSFMTYITANLISLEGKSINITKSLPTSSSKILWSKVFASDLLVIPPLILCVIITAFRFPIAPIEIIYCLLAAIIAPNLVAMFGLIINLKHPKMQFSSEAEVVKQSASVMICTFIGMFLAFFFIGLVVGFIYTPIVEFVEIGLFTIITIIFANLFGKWGTKKLNSIMV